MSFRQILKYQDHFGQVRFKNAVGKRPQGGGNPEKYALLDKRQSLSHPEKRLTCTISRPVVETGEDSDSGSGSGTGTEPAFLFCASRASVTA